MPPVSWKPFKRKRTCYVCGPTEKSVCRFPKESVRLEQWCTFCKTSPDKLLDSSRLCIEHFTETDIQVPFLDRPTLKSTAIPTVYTPNQLRRLELRPKNCNTQLKTSTVSRFKSILSENTSIQNAHHTENPPSTSEEMALTHETIRPSNDNEVIEASSWIADHILSDSFEITPVVVSDDDALDDWEETCVEPSNCIPEVIIQSHVPSTDTITNVPLSNPHQPISQLISPTSDKIVDNKPSSKPKVTRTKKSTNQSRSRKSRFTTDITTPEECLKIIRLINESTKSKMRALQKQNRRLEARVETLEKLLVELLEKNSLSVDKSEILVVSDDTED